MSYNNMIKKVILAMVLTSSMYGDMITDKIHNIIGDQGYQVNGSLIKILFKNKNHYLANGSIKYLNLFETLQKNGFLNLQFQNPSNINLEFIIQGNRKKGYVTLNTILETLGYRYFITKKLDQDEEELLWNIALKVESMLDPVIFIKELQSKGCRVVDVTKQNQYQWSYTIDFDHAMLANVKKIQKNEKVKFVKPFKPIFLDINGGRFLHVMSAGLNRWFPDIVFFDKNITVIKDIKLDTVYKELKIEIPEGAKYMKIADRYSLINIKRGLTLIVK